MDAWPLVTHASDFVVSRRQGQIGRLTLNRPRLFNALDHAMVRTLRGSLDAWRHDPAITAVIIEGAGGKAFCAGGDIRQVRDMALTGQFAAVEAFFADEYALNLAIACYPKPYVALIDGVCMGGGMGLSIHGSARVVTDAAILAMPETAIGFFPDVGASFFLPRLRDGYGMFLALTGTRVRGADAAALELATHYVARDRMALLADEIAEDGIIALSRAALPPPMSTTLAPADVVSCFKADSVTEIIKGLASLGSAPARETLSILQATSPTAMLRTFELMRRGVGHTLERCLATELALTHHAIRHPDFAEGVRAVVIDKDRNPRWSPATIDDVRFEKLSTSLCQAGDS